MILGLVKVAFDAIEGQVIKDYTPKDLKERLPLNQIAQYSFPESYVLAKDDEKVYFFSTIDI